MAILTFNDLINVYVFPHDKNKECINLDYMKTQYRLSNLVPYENYKVSLNAYATGKVQRYGIPVEIVCRTAAIGKFYALMLLSVNGKVQSVKFWVYNPSVFMLHLGNTLRWHMC